MPRLAGEPTLTAGLIIAMLHSYIEKLSRLSAYIGGLVLCAIIAMTCLSIAGRAVNGFLHGAFMQTALPDLAALLIATGIGPVRGDYEFTGAGMAFAIFAFLPLCQLRAAHASVDVFARMMPRGLDRFMLWLAECVFAIALVVIAVQLTGGLFDKMRGGETSFHLEIPVWWFYGGALWGAVISALVGIHIALLRSGEYFFGIAMPPPRDDNDNDNDGDSP